MDATCNFTSSLSGVTSTVTIDRSDATRVTGRLELTLPGGGRVQGAFDAPAVAPLFSPCETLVFDGGTPGAGCADGVCVP